MSEREMKFIRCATRGSDRDSAIRRSISAPSRADAGAAAAASGRPASSCSTVRRLGCGMTVLRPDGSRRQPASEAAASPAPVSAVASTKHGGLTMSRHIRYASRRRLLQFLAASPLLTHGALGQQLRDPAEWAPREADRLIADPRQALDVFDFEP